MRLYAVVSTSDFDQSAKSMFEFDIGMLFKFGQIRLYRSWTVIEGVRLLLSKDEDISSLSEHQISVLTEAEEKYKWFSWRLM